MDEYRMVRLLIILTTIVVAVVVALPAGLEMLEPGNLALFLNEDEFEDYLDAWLQMQQMRKGNVSARAISRNGGCQIRVNGDLGQPQPVYLHNGDYIVPTGNTGIINLETREPVTIACTGSNRIIQHPQITARVSTETAVCWNGNLVFGSGWLSGNAAFGGLTCSSHSYHVAEYTDETCFDNKRVIRVGFWVEDKFYPLYWSCFDPDRFEVLYVWYDQNPQNAVHQTGVDRPSWIASGFFPGVGINNLYTQVQQKAKIATIVGEELADKYITTTQFLSRGHLTAKTDMIFATGQRSTFYFINAAPQWQPFNGGNWNWLEQNLRARIGEAGYHTKIWTGTFGVTQLRNQNDELVDIYLNHDENNNPRLPIPLYFYKVVYEPTLKLGTAYVSINNPYYTEEEVRELQFCADHCRDNSAFEWLRWQADRVDIGYSFCCTVDEFRKTVPHLPNFEVNGLLA